MYSHIINNYMQDRVTNIPLLWAGITHHCHRWQNAYSFTCFWQIYYCNWRTILL